MIFKKGIYIFALIGLFLGETIDLLIRYKNTTLFYYAFVSLFCYLYVLAYNEKNVFRLIGTSLLIALFLSVPFIGLHIDDSSQYDMHRLTFFFIFPVMVYIGHAFHYAYHHDNTWKTHYSTLFAAVWNTILLLFVALFFTFIAYLLIMLAAYIFKTVNNLYLWNLFLNNAHFRLICDLTLFFMGIGIGQQNIEIIYSLRLLLLKMMYYLFPFLALITTLYFFLYLGHSFSAEKDYREPLMILFPLITLGIIFFNAYFQDGNTNTETPAWLKISLRIYRVVLFFLTVMMTYKMLRENFLDINTLIYLSLAILFSYTYAITAVLSEPLEHKWVKIGNVSAALFFITALFLVNLPYIPVHYTLGAGKHPPSQFLTTPQVGQPGLVHFN